MSDSPDKKLQFRGCFTPIRTVLLGGASLFCLNAIFCVGVVQYYDGAIGDGGTDNAEDVIETICPVGIDNIHLEGQGFTPVTISAPHTATGNNGGFYTITNEGGKINVESHGRYPKSNDLLDLITSPYQRYVYEHGKPSGIGYYIDENGCAVIYDTIPDTENP